MSTVTPPADREKALEAALSQIEKQFGKGTIMQMDSSGLQDVDVIPTGSIALDAALGVGGVPKGRVIEIYGPEASGKTTLCYHLIAECQRQGGKCAFIDAEHSMDPLYASTIGVNVEELLVSQPDCGEDALEIADVLTRSGGVDFIAIDSVAALTPRAELDGAMSDNSVGLQARLMGKALRKIVGNLNQTKTTLMFTNQLREKIGVFFGSPETTPGGKALKFYSSVRLDIRRIGALKDKEEIVGNRTKVKVVKNKVAPPFRLSEFDNLYGVGISSEGEIIDYGVDMEIITKSGAFFSYGELRLGQGRENTRNFLLDPVNEAVRQEIVQKIRAELGIDGVQVEQVDLVAEADQEIAEEEGEL
jgi:recombination protein RecA